MFVGWLSLGVGDIASRRQTSHVEQLVFRKTSIYCSFFGQHKCKVTLDSAVIGRQASRRTHYVLPAWESTGTELRL